MIVVTRAFQRTILCVDTMSTQTWAGNNVKAKEPNSGDVDRFRTRIEVQEEMEAFIKWMKAEGKGAKAAVSSGKFPLGSRKAIHRRITRGKPKEDRRFVLFLFCFSVSGNRAEGGNPA